MKARSIVMLVIGSFLAVGVQAQRIDVGLDAFRPTSDTQAQIQGAYLVMITSAPIGGGAARCVDFYGPARFGGIGFIPSRLPNGQPNKGLGAIAIVPYPEPGCSGEPLARMDGSPSFGDDTPRDVDFAMTSSGSIPAGAKSGRFLIAMVPTSAQPFQFCFRGPWVEQTGAPDLDPDVTIHSGNLVASNPGTPNQSFSLNPEGQAMRQGDTLQRGRFLLMYVDVKNSGTAPANAWTVTVRPPKDWQFSAVPSNCNHFNAAGVHNATSALGPGETTRLCAALMPNAPAAAVRVSAETSVANDSNPANNLSSSEFFEVQAPRGADPLPPNVLIHLDGRK